MKRKILISIALIAILVGSISTPMTSFAQEPNGNSGHSSFPGVPTTGPLSPEEIKALPDPNIDISAINRQLNADVSKVQKSAGDLQGVEVGLKAKAEQNIKDINTLKGSLTDKQRTVINEIFSKHQQILLGLITPVPPETEISLQDVQKLDAELKAWKDAFDADIAKKLTKKQMKLYKALDVDLPSLRVPTDEALNSENIQTQSCSNCYASYYYNYYTNLYAYYGYLYAYYGYAYSPYYYNYDYYAYLNAYYAYEYAYYAYLYSYYTYDSPGFLNAAYAYYYAALTDTYSYYAYVYAYYAYYYLTDTYGYFYYSYYYNYYTQAYALYGHYYARYTLYEFIN